MGDIPNLACLVTHFHVRMMVFFVGYPGHGVHESHGLVVVLEGKGLDDLPVDMFPSRQLGQITLDHDEVEGFGPSLAGFAFFLGQFTLRLESLFHKLSFLANKMKKNKPEFCHR